MYFLYVRAALARQDDTPRTAAGGDYRLFLSGFVIGLAPLQPRAFGRAMSAADGALRDDFRGFAMTPPFQLRASRAC